MGLPGRGSNRRAWGAALAAIGVVGIVAAACRSGKVHSSSVGPAVLPSTTATVEASALLFDSDRSGNFEVYLMAQDGSQAKGLTSNVRFDSWWPRVSPDRRHILFYRTPKGVHDRDYAQTSLWVMSADGTGQTELIPQGGYGWEMHGHAEWSPDGQQLVMFGGSRLNPQIYVTTPEGASPRRITNRSGVSLDPSWSPDGRTIVFVGCPGLLCFEGDYEIFTVGVDGGEATRVTKDSLRDHDPYFSPDGREIAWLTQTSSGLLGAGVWNIRISAPDGTRLRNLTNDQNINSKPEWSLDGTKIFFHRLEKGRSLFSLFSINRDGTGLREITTGQPGNNEYPSTGAGAEALPGQPEAGATGPGPSTEPLTPPAVVVCPTVKV